MNDTADISVAKGRGIDLLVMEPGGYSFGDYVKVGLPLLFLTMLITVTLVRLIYRF